MEKITFSSEFYLLCIFNGSAGAPSGGKDEVVVGGEKFAGNAHSMKVN